MTPRATRAVRVAHGVLGVLLAGYWLALPTGGARADEQVTWSGGGRITEGVGSVLVGPPVSTPAITSAPADPGVGSGQTATADLVLPVIAVGGAAAVAVYAYTRRRRRAVTRTTPGPGWGRGGVRLTALPELAREAGRLLVETDDAVRTSAEELGFAAAQFGVEAVEPFTEAVAYAKGELTHAFRLRQELDDAPPEGDTSERHMLDEIVARCTEAHRRLDAGSADFDRLRDLERSAAAALENADGAFRRVSARIDDAQATLTAIGQRYAPTAVLPVAGHVEQAKDRLVFAGTHLGAARESAGRGDNGGAAVHLRAVEGAVDQARTFVAGVERLAQELARAAERLPAALAGTDADLVDARGLVSGADDVMPTADLRARIARAESVVVEVRKAVAAGAYDPIETLRRVAQADAGLDEALVGSRESEVADQRTRSVLESVLLTARSGVATAADFVTTHRTAVGSEARTRLAAAQRHLAQSEEWESTGPAGALTEAQKADVLARQASHLAEWDVRAYGNPYSGPMGSGRGGGGTGGAILGGILLGGAGRGGRGPGSFGGAGTRGRRA